MSEEKNPFGNEPNTGHIWDGNLRELTNQPPKWWMYGLHASWIFVLLYSIIYPTWPLLSTHTKGIMGWTQIKEYTEDLTEIEQIRAPYEQRLSQMPATAILADPDLSNYAVRSAKVLFGDKCAACHGSGGAGNPGFPVLADDDWLYGGDIDTIQESIAYGREGMMPAFGAMLSPQQIDDVAKYVVALSQGGDHPAGRQIFAGEGTCSACHGDDAKGVQAMGSANLTDAIWRFTPGTEHNIKHTITHGINDTGDSNTRNAVMPAFEGKLSETDIKKLAIYVYKFGGGQ